MDGWRNPVHLHSNGHPLSRVQVEHQPDKDVSSSPAARRRESTARIESRLVKYGTIRSMSVIGYDPRYERAAACLGCLAITLLHGSGACGHE